MARDARGPRDPLDHPVDIAAVDGVPAHRSQDQPAGGPFPATRLEHPQDRDGEGPGGWLVALADQPQDSMASDGLGVVLDPHCGCLGGAQRVDAQQERKCAVVDGKGLGDLREPDQLEAVQTLGAGLIAVHPGQSGVDRRIGGDEAVDVGVAEEPA